MWSLMLGHTRTNWVADRPVTMMNNTRNTPPAPMPRDGSPERFDCSCSTSLITPHKISTAGHKRPYKVTNEKRSTTHSVIRRNRTPTRISTTGPAMERAGRGEVTGLAMTHLTRRSGRNGRSSVRWTDSWAGRDTGPGPDGALQQLRSANHEQDNWPGAVEISDVQ